MTLNICKSFRTLCVMLIPAVLAVVSLMSCTKEDKSMTLPNENVVAEWPMGVAYEIFVQSYADHNGDGIGDINGLTQKLDYLKDLGVSAIWLMPIMPSPSYHKYDVTDYYGIHADYGNIDAFKNFVNEAHKRDIKVIIDLIVNHTSNEHQWFEQSANNPGSALREYYIWANDSRIKEISSLEKAATGDSDNITQWHEHPENDKKYYGFFSGMMPDLNYDNPEVRKEVIEIGRYWLNEMNVDGFRLDAAKHIYEEYRVNDNHAWWQEFKRAMQEANPDVYLVGEVWDNTEFAASFLKGLPALFNFDLSFSILESIHKEKSVSAFIHEDAWKIDSAHSFESGYLQNQRVFQNVTSNYKDAIFLSNHDQNRILSMLDGNTEKGKLAASILLTMPGTPYIYYGEELGMLGMKPDPNIREPFLWQSDNDSLRTSWMKPEYTVESGVMPLDKQIENKASLYWHYKKLIKLRNHSNALTYGDFKPLEIQDSSLIAFTREKDGEQVAVMHNLSANEIEINTLDKLTGFNIKFFSTNPIDIVDADRIVVQPYSSIILGK